MSISRGVLICHTNTDPKVFVAMAHHRNTVSAPIRLIDNPDLEKCADNTEYRVMVFCSDGFTGPQDIAFPHSSELKVNGGEVKANLRGLKKKPGSTRPVDITNYLRLKGSYVNNVEFTYALTGKVRIRDLAASFDWGSTDKSVPGRNSSWPSMCAR